MLTPEKMGAAILAVTDQLVAVLEAHERADHGGEICPGNRLSAVAFIAHRLGVNTFRSGWPAFVTVLKQYERDCPGCQKAIAEMEKDQ